MSHNSVIFDSIKTSAISMVHAYTKMSLSQVEGNYVLNTTIGSLFWITYAVIAHIRFVQYRKKNCAADKMHERE